jgi:Na+/H+ antiporter NhaC
MIIPFIFLILVVAGVIYFLVFAGKKKAKGDDLGENQR